MNAHRRLKHGSIRVARRIGYEPIGLGGVRALHTYRLHRVTADPPFEHAYRGGGTFTINLDEAITPSFWSYAEAGWHPRVETLRQYAEGGGLTFERTPMAQYQQRRIKRRSLYDMLFDGGDQPARGMLDSLPPRAGFRHRIWALTPRNVRWLLRHDARTREVRDGDYDWRGDFEHLVAIYENIREHGYRPEAVGAPPISGYFISDGRTRRFVVIDGDHRCAALRVLGLTDVEATYAPWHPPAVDVVNLHQFSTTGIGILPPDAAEVLLDKLLAITGREKAQRAGLIGRDRGG